MRAFAALAITLAVLAATPARAADPAVYGGTAAGLPSSPGIPACDSPSVLADIVERQHWAERNTWKNGVRLEAISAIRQIYRTTRFVSSIQHRHCVARANLSLGLSDALYYTISRQQGFASWYWRVEFCMPQHDYYRVYDADCRVLR